MNIWSVAVPITGVIHVEVEAETEAEAEEAALASDDLTLENLDSWSTHRQVTRGNVCYAELNQIDAQCIGESDASPTTKD